MNALLLISALIGTTLIVVRGTIFAPLRKYWPTFLGCSQCVGFWTGVAGGASSVVSLGYGRALDAFVIGTATSFLSLSADAMLLFLLGSPEDE